MTTRSYHQVLRRIRDRITVVGMLVFDVVATAVFFLVYILILPWFAVFAPRIQEPIRTNWHSWTLTNDTLEDVKKQY